MDGGHHLILGELEDFLTGQKIKDTHDERYRQKIARFLVDEKGFSKNDIKKNHELHLHVDNNTAAMKVDFLVSVSGKTGMLIKYGPGSLTTRHHPALAIAKIIEPYQIPVVVVTNGETADILDGETGRVTGQGFDAIFSEEMLKTRMQSSRLIEISTAKKEMATRILYAFEINDRCPCDDDVCILRNNTTGNSDNDHT